MGHGATERAWVSSRHSARNGVHYVELEMLQVQWDNSNIIISPFRCCCFLLCFSGWALFFALSALKSESMYSLSVGSRGHRLTCWKRSRHTTSLSIYRMQSAKQRGTERWRLLLWPVHKSLRFNNNNRRRENRFTSSIRCLWRIVTKCFDSLTNRFNELVGKTANGSDWTSFVWHIGDWQSTSTTSAPLPLGLCLVWVGQWKLWKTFFDFISMIC